MSVSTVNCLIRATGNDILQNADVRRYERHERRVTGLLMVDEEFVLQATAIGALAYTDMNATLEANLFSQPSDTI